MEIASIPKRTLFGSSAAAKAARRFGLTVMCVTMLMTAAFGSGVYWNKLHAQGTPARARMILPAADEEIGCQAMHRMWEDMRASIDALRENASADGWRGESARIYLNHLREEVGK